MGHIRLGVLPRSRKWQQVIEELRLGSDVNTIAAAAADAAEAAFQRASTDPAFLHAFWLLTQIPLAARGPAFAADLRRLGLAVGEQPSLMEVLGAFSGAVDRYQRGAWIRGAVALTPTPSRSGEADIARASQLQHAIEDVSGDVHLGRPTL